MDRNDRIPSTFRRWLGRLAPAVLLAMCTACGADDGPRTCDDIASAMIEACADEYEALATCIEESLLPNECAQQNLAHGRCLQEVEGEITVEDHVAAFAVYLCEVAEEPGDRCDQSIAECT